MCEVMQIQQRGHSKLYHLPFPKQASPSDARTRTTRARATGALAKAVCCLSRAAVRRAPAPGDLRRASML